MGLTLSPGFFLRAEYLHGGSYFARSYGYREGSQDRGENSVATFPKWQGRRCSQKQPQDGRETALSSMSLVSLGAG